MADFQRWERQLLPQGGLVAPQTGPSLAESFSQGLSGLANTAAKTVESVQQTDEWRGQKEWEIAGQPKAAAFVNKLQLGVAEQLPEIKAGAAPGLADYPDKIDDLIARATEDGLKDNPDPRFQQYVRAHMDAFRVSSVAEGIQDRTAATLARDANVLHDLVNDQSVLVDKNFAQFDTAAKLIDDTISGNQHFTADQKAELSRMSKQSIAIAGLNGLRERNPDAAMKELNSGKFDAILGVAYRQGLLADIKSEQEGKAVQAKIAADNRRQAQLNDLNARLKPAFDQALTTGKYDKVAPREIIDVFGEEQGKKILANLNNARYMGQDALSIAHQSSREDSQLLKTLSDVPTTNKEDEERARQRFAFAQDLINEKRWGLEHNPEEFVRTHTPAVQEKWDAFDEKPSDPDRLLGALETAVQAQSKQGVPRDKLDPVPQASADTAVAYAKAAGPNVIPYFQKTFGVYAPHLIEKIARKYGPFVTTAFTMEEPSQRQAQAVLLKLSDDPQAVPDLEKNLAIDSERRVDVEQAVFGRLEQVRQSYAAQVGGDAAFPKIYDSTYALTLFYMSKDGQSLDEASARAADEIAADHYSFRQVNQHTYRIPRKYSGASVAQGARVYLANLANTNLDLPPEESKIGKEAVARSLQETGWWSTLPDESGLVLHFKNGAPATRNGKRITVTWRELELISSHHPEPHYSSASRYHQ